MPSRTNLKLSETIRQRAAHVILHELKDPRMGFVTVTKVKLSPDLSTCVVFWSALGTAADRSKTTHALDSARLYIQRRVAEGLHTRVAPQLSFEYDESVEGAIRMGGLLKELREKRGDAPAAASEPDVTGAADAPADETAGATPDVAEGEAVDEPPDASPDERSS